MSTMSAILCRTDFSGTKDTLPGMTAHHGADYIRPLLPMREDYPEILGYLQEIFLRTDQQALWGLLLFYILCFCFAKFCSIGNGYHLSLSKAQNRKGPRIRPRHF